MESFVYHMVPKELKGDKLIPLNSLKEAHPNLYIKYSKKYFDHPERKKLLARQIPELNCLWNDVLHFLPLHPYYVYEALSNIGVKTKEDQLFFKIPIQKLKNNKNAYYLYTKEKYRGPAEDIEEDEIKPLDIENYKELKGIPIDTIEYYKIQNEKGSRFGLFPFIPHIFSYGEVEIRSVETITWNRLE